MRKMNAELNLILEDNEENRLELHEAEKEILLLNPPRSWNVYVAGNMEIEMEVEFEKFLISVSEHTNENIETISVFKFNVLVDYLKEKNKNG